MSLCDWSSLFCIVQLILNLVWRFFQEWQSLLAGFSVSPCIRHICWETLKFVTWGQINIILAAFDCFKTCIHLFQWFCITKLLHFLGLITHCIHWMIIQCAKHIYCCKIWTPSIFWSSSDLAVRVLGTAWKLDIIISTSVISNLPGVTHHCKAPIRDWKIVCWS